MSHATVSVVTSVRHREGVENSDSGASGYLYAVLTRAVFPRVSQSVMW